MSLQHVRLGLIWMRVFLGVVETEPVAEPPAPLCQWSPDIEMWMEPRRRAKRSITIRRAHIGRRERNALR